MRVATISGFLISLLSVAVGLAYLALKLIMWDQFPMGNAPILFGVFIIGGIQVFFIGLVGEYVLSINTRVMKRPLVIEERRLNFDEERVNEAL
jgi:hypothetical protein